MILDRVNRVVESTACLQDREDSLQSVVSLHLVLDRLLLFLSCVPGLTGHPADPDSNRFEAAHPDAAVEPLRKALPGYLLLPTLVERRQEKTDEERCGSREALRRESADS